MVLRCGQLRSARRGGFRVCRLAGSKAYAIGWGGGGGGGGGVVLRPEWRLSVFRSFAPISFSPYMCVEATVFLFECDENEN